LEEFPDLKKQIADTDYEEGSMGAFLKALPSDNVDAKGLPNSHTSQEVTTMPDQRRIFVVHGRDDRLRLDFFAFLRALDLQPLEWSEALRLTGKASPYIGEVLDKAFESAQAIVVLLTPDDEVRLVKELWQPNEVESEKEIHIQARPNVLFEAGMAFGRNPDRTLLIQVGRVKGFSDIAGRHVVRLSNSSESRQDVAERLRTAGCAVSTSGRDWLQQGDFSVSRGENRTGSEHGEEEPTVKWVDLSYPRDVGLQAELETKGYQVRWCQEDKLARRLDLEGWSLVTQTTKSGQNVVLKVKDRPHNQTLIMRREAK
jgi:predicted nucleotide-binding protein